MRTTTIFLFLVLVSFSYALNITSLHDDSVVASVPAGNYGQNTQMRVEEKIGADRHIYYGFDFTGIGEVQSANISIWCYDDPAVSSGEYLDFYFCNDTFDEDTITWNNQDTEVTDCYTDPFIHEASTAFSATTRYDFNITSQINNNVENFTIKLKLNPNGGTYRLDFWSGDNPAETTKHPVIRYTLVETGDSTPPLISYVDPTDINTTIPRNYTYINITANENLNDCDLNFNGSSYDMNNNSITNFYYYLSALNNGNYTFNVTCNDTSSNIGYASNTWLYVNDTYTAPEIPILNNFSYWKDTCLSNTFWVLINIDANDIIYLNISSNGASYSNGSLVFDWFEDWSSYTDYTDMNNNGWVMYGNEGPNWVNQYDITSGVLHFETDASNSFGCDIGFEKIFPEKSSLVVTQCKKDASAAKPQGFVSQDSAAYMKLYGYNATIRDYSMAGDFEYYYLQMTGGLYGNDTALNLAKGNSWFMVTSYYNSSDVVNLYYNGTSLSNNSILGIADFNLKYYSICAGQENEEIWSDYVYGRKYAKTEPTVTVINMGTWYNVTIDNSGYNYDLTEFQVKIPNIPYTNITITQLSNVTQECTPSYLNTSWSVWQDVTICNITDQKTQNRSLTQYDVNDCEGSTNTTYWDTRILSCNYCSYSVTYTEWSGDSCGNRTYWDANYNDCCNITFLGSDCYLNDNSTYWGNYTETSVCSQCSYCDVAKSIYYVPIALILIGTLAILAYFARKAEDNNIKGLYSLFVIYGITYAVNIGRVMAVDANASSDLVSSLEIMYASFLILSLFVTVFTVAKFFIALIIKVNS